MANELIMPHPDCKDPEFVKDLIGAISERVTEFDEKALEADFKSLIDDIMKGRLRGDEVKAKVLEIVRKS